MPRKIRSLPRALEALDSATTVAELQAAKASIGIAPLSKPSGAYNTVEAAYENRLNAINAEETTDPRFLALAAHLDVPVSTISETEYGNNGYKSDDAPGEYLVVTDEEADTLWEESLDSYIDDCLLSFNTSIATPGSTAPCFDGRGHSLSSYDGEEHEEKIDGVWYYIYRVN